MPSRQQSPRILLQACAYFALLTAGLCDGPTGPGNGVASVQMTATSSNPRVGETTTIGATPVGPGGVAVPGIPCTYASSNTGVLALTPNGAGTSGLGVTPGTSTVTATCGGVNGQVEITVRPQLVTFSVTKNGTGNGSVFINPPGGSYDAGTTVTATATPLAGSTFAGWGGACAAAGTNSQCIRLLSANQVATATFAQIPQVYVGPAVPSASVGTATAWNGCQYGISASANLSVSLTQDDVGTLSGTTTGGVNVGITVNFTPPGNSCTPNPYSHVLAGTISGNDAAVVMNAASSGGSHYVNFTGARSANTIVGTLIIHVVTSDGLTNFHFDRTVNNYTLTKVP